MMTTAILTDQRYLVHTDPSHVERAERLQAIYKALDTTGLRAHLGSLEARNATPAELQAVHTERHLETIERFGLHGGGYIDADTYMVDGSWEAALLASGGVIHTVEAVVNRDYANAFALVRPPGHHATPDRAMGFCLINNIAVGARYAIQHMGLERVAIVDYDVHHGNGTQDAFYADPNVLFCSTHASPYYPGTGRLDEIGSGDAAGATLNVPLPFGVGDQGYQQVFQEVIIPALHAWKPQLLLVSAGYDSHWRDPIGPMIASTYGFAQMTRMLRDAAAELCDGRIAMVLEGGYSLEGLSDSVIAALHVLLGQEPTIEERSDIRGAPEPDLSALVQSVRQRHPLFKNIN